MPVSRRAVITAAMGIAAAAAPTTALTAAEVVERIRRNVGVPWREKTVDHIVLGTGDTPVAGIATTMMATLDVLERASAAGRNLVISHETPVYLHQDDTSDLVDDPTYQYKVRYVRDHGMAVFHFHDHWHARKPDGIAVGMMRDLGWTENTDPQDLHRFTFDGISLEDLARHIASRLQARTLRLMGDPKLAVHHALASWGFSSRMPGIAQFREPGVDVFIVGETREWELVEYVQDTITRGEKKAMIVIGHIASEQAGMKYCAEWLRSFIPEVPIALIPAVEPFRSL